MDTILERFAAAYKRLGWKLPTWEEAGDLYILYAMQQPADAHFVARVEHWRDGQLLTDNDITHAQALCIFAEHTRIELEKREFVILQRAQSTPEGIYSIMVYKFASISVDPMPDYLPFHEAQIAALESLAKKEEK